MVGLLEHSRKSLQRSRGKVTQQRHCCHQDLFLVWAKLQSAPMIWVAEEGEDDPPLRHAELPPLLHTGFTFYYFLSSLPFDGLLCVQAVGKFLEMMSFSTGDSPIANAIHPHTSCCPPVKVPLFHLLCRDQDLTGPWFRLDLLVRSQLEEMLRGKIKNTFVSIKHICEVRVNALLFL